ncbi:MAG: RDD family protein [Pyrinomonadaceae bacterium]
MRNDSVREELQSKVSARTESGRLIAEPAEAPAAAVSAPPRPEAAPLPRRSSTADLSTKDTSPTLADFRHLNPELPEWRLKLQNSVRLRTGRGSGEEAVSGPAPALSISASPLTRGSNALKHAPVNDPFENEDVDPKILNALKRIEISRRKYLGSEKAREGIRVAKAASKRFPFDVVSRSDELPAKPVQGTPPIGASRPKLASPLKIEKGKYDTNKLKPIPEAEYLEKPRTAETQSAKPLKENWSTRIEIKEKEEPDVAAVPVPETVVEPEPAVETIDDLAPMAMRFNAGLFDLIVGGFLAFILLSPYFALSEGWFSVSGLLLFASVLTLVMFVYLTAATAFFGQTIGMRLFGLELLDYESNEAASLHQSAVNAAVYLPSLLLAGLGFIPAFFNEENRAAHDLAAGTILVRAI